MLLGANSNRFRLSGGVVVKKVGSNYEKVRADIIVNNNIIEAIIENPRSHDSDITVIELDAEDIILPGLIDLHNHHDYNMMPLWPIPSECKGEYWDIRHQWRNCGQYTTDIKEFRSFLEAKWNENLAKGKTKVDFNTAFQFFSELQAVAGGTTVLQEPNTIVYSDPSKKDYIASHLLLRSTGVAEDLGLESRKELFSVIDFMKPYLNSAGKVEIPPDQIYPHVDTSLWPVSTTKEFEEFRKVLSGESKNQPAGYLVHLAEGRTETSASKMDPCTNKEFEMFKAEIMKYDAARVKAMKISLIHGCGIGLYGEQLEKNKEFLSKYGIGLIWSPVSNLLLYGVTPEFYNKLYKNGVTISLGSDWAPSGSKHVWDEAYFAYDYLRHDNREDEFLLDRIMDMVTINPAKTIGANKLGEIKVGYFADFMILSKKRTKQNLDCSKLDRLFDFTDIDTKAVIINGNLIYGDGYMFDEFKLNRSECADISNDGIAAKGKRIRIPVETKINFNEDLKLLDEIFNSYTGSKTKMYRSKFLSQNDAKYLDAITKLKEKFCKNKYIPIYNQDDFIRIKNNPSGAYLLMNDIKLDESYVQKAGYVRFQGILDGQGYKVNIKNASIFYYIYGIVMNLKVTGIINGSSTDSVFATCNSGKILNCSSEVSVNGDRNTRFGGFVRENRGIIYNCVNSGSITAGLNVAGICIANMDSGIISNCSNRGNITRIRVEHRETYNAGGICATVQEGAKIINCYNIGNVTSPSEDGGGICGAMFGPAEIKKCYNSGHVVAERAGGIVGWSGWNMPGKYLSDCYNTGTVECEIMAAGICAPSWVLSVENCYNVGEIRESASLDYKEYAGEILGSERLDMVVPPRSFVKNAYFNDSISKIHKAIGTNADELRDAAKTTQEMVADRFVQKLNVDAFVKPKHTDGQHYPELKVFAESSDATVREDSKRSTKVK